MGADPQHKDIFLEVDWMFEAGACTASELVCAPPVDQSPAAEAIAVVVAAFANSPLMNPDGTTGVRMHVDHGSGSTMTAAVGDDAATPWGELSRAGQVALDKDLGAFVGDDYDWTEFDAIKTAHFDVARRDAFHYVVYGWNYGGGSSSGVSRGLPGADLIVTKADYPWTITAEAGTFMHELGHNLSLRHAGDDHVPNPRDGYDSIMSYMYQFPGVPGRGVDYSAGTPGRVQLLGAGAGTEVDTIGYDDWSHVVFTGGSIGDLGDSAPDPATTPVLAELTVDEARQNGFFGLPGDGVVTLLGPTLAATGVDGQVLVFDVTNTGNVDADYQLDLDVAWLASPTTVTVPADSTTRVTVPVTIGAAGAAVELVTASLFNGDDLLSTSQLAVNVVDLDDDGMADRVGTTLDELDANPPAGLAPEVVDVLQAALRPALDAAAAPSPDAVGPDGAGAAASSDDSGVPAWVWIAVAVAVLLAAGGLVAARSRKRR